MTNDEKRPSEPGTMFTHLPLPYVVHVRVMMSEDAFPETHIVRLMAYSIFEAMCQASQQLGGGTILDDAKVKIERIEPDVPEYQRIFYGYIAAVASQGVRTK